MFRSLFFYGFVKSTSKERKLAFGSLSSAGNSPKTRKMTENVDLDDENVPFRSTGKKLLPLQLRELSGPVYLKILILLLVYISFHRNMR